MLLGDPGHAIRPFSVERLPESGSFQASSLGAVDGLRIAQVAEQPLGRLRNETIGVCHGHPLHYLFFRRSIVA
jgi:hypothetical protein